MYTYCFTNLHVFKNLLIVYSVQKRGKGVGWKICSHFQFCIRFHLLLEQTSLLGSWYIQRLRVLTGLQWMLWRKILIKIICINCLLYFMIFCYQQIIFSYQKSNFCCPNNDFWYQKFHFLIPENTCDFLISRIQISAIKISFLGCKKL